VDLEDDLIPYLGSPLSFAMYEDGGPREWEAPVGIALWIPLKEGHKADRLLEDAADAMEAEGARVDTSSIADGVWYTFRNGRTRLFGFGVLNEHIVVAIGSETIRAVSTAMKGDDEGFLGSLSSKKLKGVVKAGPESVLWLDGANLLATDFARDLSDEAEEDLSGQQFGFGRGLVDSVSHIVITSETSKSRSVAELTVHASEGPEGEKFPQVALMLLVGGSGLGAPVAIPNFIAMQLRAKRSEAPTNVDGIRTAEKAYHHEWDAFTSARSTPTYVAGRAQVAFTGGGYRNFENLGWTADGKVRCQYKVTARNAVYAAGDDFTVTGTCDVDGDGVYSIYQANRAEKARMMTSNNVY
jgi:hypothetical protein